MAFALQTLSSLYFGLFLGVYLVPLSAVLWLAKGRPRAAVRALAVGMVLGGLIIAPAAWQYIKNKPMLGERSSDAVQYYSATPEDYLKPHFRSRLYSDWSGGGRAERQLFPGFVAIALAVLGASYMSLAWAALAATIAAALLSTLFRPKGLSWIPSLREVRRMDRIFSRTRSTESRLDFRSGVQVEPVFEGIDLHAQGRQGERPGASWFFRGGPGLQPWRLRTLVCLQQTGERTDHHAVGIVHASLQGEGS